VTIIDCSRKTRRGFRLAAGLDAAGSRADDDDTLEMHAYASERERE
jgi:hypothetical protein